MEDFISAAVPKTNHRGHLGYGIFATRTVASPQDMRNKNLKDTKLRDKKRRSKEGPGETCNDTPSDPQTQNPRMARKRSEGGSEYCILQVMEPEMSTCRRVWVPLFLFPIRRVEIPHLKGNKMKLISHPIIIISQMYRDTSARYSETATYGIVEKPPYRAQ